MIDVEVGGSQANATSDSRPLSSANHSEARSIPGRVAAIVLAAGRSSRMGRNKLLLPLSDGRSMVEHVVDQVSAAGAHPLIVVLGHEGDFVRAALAEHDIVFVENQYYADGLATSLKTGIRAVPEDATGFLVCLGDMPAVGARQLRHIIDAFVSDPGAGIVVPIRHGRQGNPVLWSRRYIPELLELSGDRGAKDLVRLHADHVIELQAADDGVILDLDTPEALLRFLRSRDTGSAAKG